MMLLPNSDDGNDDGNDDNNANNDNIEDVYNDVNNDWDVWMNVVWNDDENNYDTNKDFLIFADWTIARFAIVVRKSSDRDWTSEQVSWVLRCLCDSSDHSGHCESSFL